MKPNLIPYWISLASAKHMSNRRKMELLIQVVHGKTPLNEAFSAMQAGNRLGFDFTEREWEGMVTAITETPNNAFVAERLQAGGIEVIPIMEKFIYPPSLKSNLKKDAPIVIYAKGNMDLLKRPMVAIVGARKSGLSALEFTDNIAEKAVRNQKVIVSGFAKGVDQRALDAALKFGGQSIIVLPQGIETYRSKDYYAAMVRGDLLILSVYHPKSPWSVGLAMDRNKIIYGLADEIYAAESNESGGTWEGVRDGLKRGRKIYVRQALNGEKNANALLIGQGAIAVNQFGELTNALPHQPRPYPTTVANPMTLKEPSAAHYAAGSTDSQKLEDRIKSLLLQENKMGWSIQEIANTLGFDEKAKKKLPRLLEGLEPVKKEKRGRVNYYHWDAKMGIQGSLF
jgi:DNA processing protein